MSWTAYFLSSAKSLQTGFSITSSISYNLLQSLLNSLFINSAKSKQVSSSEFLGSLKFRVSQFYYLRDLLCRSFIFSQHFCLAASASWSPGVLQLRRLGAQASCSLGISEPRRLVGRASHNLGVSEPGHLAALGSLRFDVSQLVRLVVLPSCRLNVSQFYYLLSCNLTVSKIYCLGVLLSCCFTIL